MSLIVYSETELPEEILQYRLLKLRREKNWYRLIHTLTATAFVVFFLFGVFLGIALVRGPSMTPSFHDGDLVMIWRLSENYTCDDVICFKYGSEPHELIKRVVAVPGDTVDTDTAGRLTINGQVLAATVTKPGIRYPLTLLENEYFVLGDNRENAMDSRNFGPVGKKDIDGKVILILRTHIY